MTPEHYWRGFAAWAAGPLDLPGIVRDRAAFAFIDTVAVILAGIGTPAARAAAEVARSMGAGPAAIAGGGRIAAPAAALANATAGHALDFDDYDRPSVAHPSTVLIPAILALTEAEGATGQNCLTAFAVGIEAMDRMGEAINPGHYAAGYHATGTLGTLGAAAAGARLMRLDAVQTLTAMALAAGMAAGFKAQFGTGAKALNAGHAAETGVKAALLARAGLSAAPEALWGDLGFAGLSGGGATRLPRPPGAPFALAQYGLVVKPWPCCGYLGRILGAVEQLTGEIDASQIERIELEAPERNAAVIPFALPETPDQARFSAPYTVATMVLTSSVTPADFTDEAIRRSDILALAARIMLTPSKAVQGPEDLSPDDPDLIRIILTDGQVAEHIVRDLPGSPERPLSRDGHIAKLKTCAEAVLSPDDLASLIAALEALPNLEMVTPVTDILERAR